MCFQPPRPLSYPPKGAFTVAETQDMVAETMWSVSRIHGCGHVRTYVPTSASKAGTSVHAGLRTGGTYVRTSLRTRDKHTHRTSGGRGGKTYSAILNSGLHFNSGVSENLAVAGITIRRIRLRNCEFRGKLTVADIKVSGCMETAQFSFRNLYKLGPRAAKKLTVAGIEIRLIELESCELLQKLAVAGIEMC